MIVEVRWAIGDWSKENRSEINAGNFNSVTYTYFKATVPVEKYETAGRIFVHFFPEGKVRVISSESSVIGASHPIQRGDPHAIESATAGQRIAAVFSESELADMQRQNEKRHTFFGDWR